LNTSHQSFPQPRDAAIPVWRYLTLAKFISVLTEKALYFSRADLLGDPFEGTIPAQNAINVSTQFCDPTRPDLIIKVRKMWRLFTYVSCWHLNETESEAMWRIHCPTNEGVALKTTYAKLGRSIPSNDFYLGTIRYLDYRSQLMLLDNAFNPVMHKRKAFEHEREARVVKLESVNIQSVEKDFDELACQIQNPRGINVPIDIENTFDAIYVNPYAPTWYYEVVREVLDKFSISVPLEWSHIADTPHH
jgi:hypothetical protein